MEPFVQGWGLTIALCSFIVLVFIAGWLHVHRELSWVKTLTDLLGDELVGETKLILRRLGYWLVVTLSHGS